MYLKADEDYLKANFIKKETSVSNNVFERKLFDGFLQSQCSNDFIFLSAPSVGWFPFNCKKLMIKGFSNTNHYTSVNYLATYVGSTFSKTKSLTKAIAKVIKQIDLNEYEICLILNELHLPYLKCAEYLKKRMPNVTTIQLVPDLPEFNNRSNHFLYKCLKKINCRKINKLRIRFIDKYVLFSKPMVDYLKLTHKKNWIVNEGIKTDEVVSSCLLTDNKKHIVFIGKIDKRNGVDIILKTADLFKERDDVVFDFYGIGASDSAFSNFSLDRSNVIVHGFLNPSEVAATLSSASVLLSPRHSNEEYTKYSFPSKIFDYLSSYKPIVTFKLDCYPHELDKILFYPKDASAFALFDCINEVLRGALVNKKEIDSFLSKYSKEVVVNKILGLAKKEL